jgi:hypothetical protein
MIIIILIFSVRKGIVENRRSKRDGSGTAGRQEKCLSGFAVPPSHSRFLALYNAEFVR